MEGAVRVDTGWMDERSRSSLSQYQPLGWLGTPTDMVSVASFRSQERADGCRGGFLNLMEARFLEHALVDKQIEIPLRRRWD